MVRQEKRMRERNELLFIGSWLRAKLEKVCECDVDEREKKKRMMNHLFVHIVKDDVRRSSSMNVDWTQLL